MITLTFEAETADEIRHQMTVFLGTTAVAAALTVDAPKAEEPKAPRARAPKAEEAPKTAENPTEGSKTPAKSADDQATDGKSPTSSEVSDTSAQSASDAPAMEYSVVRTEVLKLNRDKGREAVEGLLKHFGAERSAQEIDPAKWPEVLAYIAEKLGA